MRQINDFFEPDAYGILFYLLVLVVNGLNGMDVTEFVQTTGWYWMGRGLVLWAIRRWL